jgi:hypothetical protein
MARQPDGSHSPVVESNQSAAELAGELELEGEGDLEAEAPAASSREELLCTICGLRACWQPAPA